MQFDEIFGLVLGTQNTNMPNNRIQRAATTNISFLLSRCQLSLFIHSHFLH